MLNKLQSKELTCECHTSLRNLLSVPVGEAHRLRDGVRSFGIQSQKGFVAVVVVHLLCSNCGLCFEVVSKMQTNQFKLHGGKRTK